MTTIDVMVPSDTQGGIIVAFSGGADSLALLVLLASKVDKTRLTAVYVNHRLRPSAELAREEEINRRNCNELGVSLRIVRLKRGAVEKLARSRKNGIEDAARVLRYEALQQVRQELKFTYIATAHTADDQAETLLMRILQGAGPLSLKGIGGHEGDVIRPLLAFTRADILAVVKKSGLEWSQDSTNKNLTFLRNRIRHEIIPAISQVFPNYRAALEVMSQRSRDYGEALEPAIQSAIEQGVEVHDQQVRLDVALLETLPRAVAEQVFYHGWSVITGGEGKRFPYRHVAQLLDQLAAGWDEGLALYVSKTVVTRENTRLVWEKQGIPLAAGYVSLVYSKQTALDGTSVLVLDEELESQVPKEARARIAADTVSPPLVARSYKAGDVIELVEGTKMVSSLLAGWKIASPERWRVPVLEDKKGIVAVLGGTYGGRDRIAKRCILAGLARNGATLYSVTNIEGCDCE